MVAVEKSGECGWPPPRTGKGKRGSFWESIKRIGRFRVPSEFYFGVTIKFPYRGDLEKGAWRDIANNDRGNVGAMGFLVLGTGKYSRGFSVRQINFALRALVCMIDQLKHTLLLRNFWEGTVVRVWWIYLFSFNLEICSVSIRVNISMELWKCKGLKQLLLTLICNV